mmetsp:Transcript_22648/g.37142  ORF Transcript_22648/g.37142 Transcript_22648/m.37142 type:complete len:223 (-) Transcript_22648:4605-5273(-)
MHDLVQQQPLTQHGRKLVGNLIGTAVLPGEEHRHYGRTRPADQLRGENVPFTFDRRTPPCVRHSDNARREQGNNAPVLQMRHRLGAHLDALALRILIVGKRHRDHVTARDLIDRRQKRPGQDAVIGAHAPNQIGKDHAVDHPVRVVGDNYDGAFLGNTIQLRLGCGKVDPHHIQASTPERLALWRTLTLKLADQAENGQLASQRFHHPDERGFPRVFKGRSI